MPNQQQIYPNTKYYINPKQCTTSTPINIFLIGNVACVLWMVFNKDIPFHLPMIQHPSDPRRRPMEFLEVGIVLLCSGIAGSLWPYTAIGRPSRVHHCIHQSCKESKSSPTFVTAPRVYRQTNKYGVWLGMKRDPICYWLGGNITWTMLQSLEGL